MEPSIQTEHEQNGVDGKLVVPHIDVDGEIVYRSLWYNYPENVMLRILPLFYNGFTGEIVSTEESVYAGTCSNASGFTYSFRIRADAGIFPTGESGESFVNKQCMSVFLHFLTYHVTKYGQVYQNHVLPASQPQDVTDYDWLITTTAYAIAQSGKYRPVDFPMFKSVIPE